MENALMDHGGEDARSAPLLLDCHRLRFAYPGAQEPSLQDFVLKVNGAVGGRSVALVGPSGCGKSTLLRLCAGLETPSAGDIRILGWSGRELLGRCGMIFQESTCFDWLTVLGNVTFPLRLKGIKAEVAEIEGHEYLDLVGLARLAGFYPYQLSVGMRQRLAIARALASRPDVLLMDEPFSALDAITREDVQLAAIDARRKRRSNLLVVTHDVAEAVFLADEVLVLTGRPLRLVARHNIPLGDHDRNASFRYSSQFFDLSRGVYESLQAARLQIRVG